MDDANQGMTKTDEAVSTVDFVMAEVEDAPADQQCYYAACSQGEYGPKESYADANQRARAHEAATGHDSGVLGPTFC